MKREKLESGWINTIQESVAVAFAQAVQNDTEVEFDFNGINVVVSATTSVTRLLRDYFNAHLMTWHEIGPNPVTEYSEETEIAIKLAKEECDRQDKERQLEYERKQAERLEAFNKEVEGIEMEFTNKEVWDASKAANTDPYGNACLVYAENLAKLIQKHIGEGKTLAECADEDTHKADTEGITGFMYGMAIGILANCWKHGEELRQWHNKSYGHEGSGTVNPAIVTVSSKE